MYLDSQCHSQSCHGSQILPEGWVCLTCAHFGRGPAAITVFDVFLGMVTQKSFKLSSTCVMLGIRIVRYDLASNHHDEQML